MERKTYSISVRLKRTRIEYAFVSVPIDGTVMEPDPEDGNKPRVNPEKVFEAASASERKRQFFGRRKATSD